MQAGLAHFSAVLAVLGVLLMVAPPLHWYQWLAHFVAIEGSFFVFAAGLATFLAATHPAHRLIGVLAMIVGLLPFLLTSATLNRHSFSPLAYFGFTGVPHLEPKRDIVLDVNQPDLRVDLYPGIGEGLRPFVLVVHGGSWRGGDKGEVPLMSQALAAAGFTVFDVRYRLAPAAPFPAGIADVKCALGKIREQSATFGIDPQRAALLGRSAGGHMALLTAYTAGHAQLTPGCDVVDAPVQRVVGLYAPTDLAWGHAHPFVPDAADSIPAIEAYLGGTPATVPETYHLASPLFHVENAPPTLLITGTAEHVVRPYHTETLATALRAAGKDVRVLSVPFAEHGFDVRPGGIGEQLARQEILDFLKDL